MSRSGAGFSRNWVIMPFALVFMIPRPVASFLEIVFAATVSSAPESMCLWSILEKSIL